MSKSELIDNICLDLANEYLHMNFYMQSSFLVSGLHREELQEFLWESSQSEMQHIKMFANMICGFDVTPPVHYKEFPSLSKPQDILSYALEMELNVVNNYIERIKQAEDLGGVDGKFIQVFYEDQLLDSRQDIDNLRKMLEN